MVLSLDVMKPHGTTGIVACVGLDRFLRLYDMSTRASLGNMYCKTKMTSVLIVDGSSDAVSQEPCGPTKRKASQDSDSSDENEETDQIWSRLPKVDDVGDVSTKRRRTSERTTRSRDN
jgi:hypothetical protein